MEKYMKQIVQTEVRLVLFPKCKNPVIASLGEIETLYIYQKIIFDSDF
jgi:hypothetical protein